jgi:hypothetical protein
MPPEVSSLPPAAAEQPSSEAPSAAPAGISHSWLHRALARHEIGAWFISAAAHTVVLVALGLIVQHVIKVSNSVSVDISAAPPIDNNALEHGPTETVPGAAGGPSPTIPTPGMFDGDPLLSNLGDAPIGIPDFGTPSTHLPKDVDRAAGPLDPLASSLSSDTNGAAWGQPLSKGGGGLGGRTPGRRGQLVGTGGGTPASEAAVERGLKWLLVHQRDDGGWRFSFEAAPCEGQCRNGGVETSTTAATAMALLPFFGAGYTQNEGPYKDEVNRGLYYLTGRMLATPQGGDLQEGTMYAQGLSTIVLCEAYAMSNDEHLRPFAQQAVNYIVYAQDHHGGGWRYFPGQAGDTTVSGWQLMALKSAQMAGLEVPSQTFFLAGKFLDSVQSEKGAAYGYIRPGSGAATTAAGLLCRMYLGWGRQHPALVAGINGIDKLGPMQTEPSGEAHTDLYFDYYATQVLYHHGGPQWERWNKKMRDYLIATQSSEGHESGSWYFQNQHLDKGGRLCNTSLAILTLEVYYRYLPLYSTRAVDEGF